MDFAPLAIDGLLEIRPRKRADERGYFAETFRQAEFVEHAGPVEFVQENQSLSTRAGTVRGIHFQAPPAAQGKLVRCIAGSLLDVAVDLRSGSPTFGQWASIVLSAEHCNQLWIPEGFGHGFCTLEPDCVISYRVTEYYSPEHDRGLAWNDPRIGIDWPDIADPATLSERDRQLPGLTQVGEIFPAAI